jgi:integration host factor subunit beta
MTRADLTKQVHQAIEMPRKESEVVVCAIFDSIVRALRSGDKVEIRGFGSFHTRQRRARIGRNPKTGSRVEVPPKNMPENDHASPAGSRSSSIPIVQPAGLTDITNGGSPSAGSN